MKNSLFLAILLFSFIGLYAQKTLTPVDEGSKIHFVIKNLGINTGGDLSGLKGTIKLNTKTPSASSIDVTVAVNTIDTDNEKRDKHLKNDDYFDAEKYPTIRIVSTKIAAASGINNYTLTGNLTIKDVTKAISFPFTLAANANGTYTLAGNFEIDRRDYHVGGNSATMSDNVKVELTVVAK